MKACLQCFDRCNLLNEAIVDCYLSKMSAMIQEYINSPSGNWIATLLALACFNLHTVLCIYISATLRCSSIVARLSSAVLLYTTITVAAQASLPQSYSLQVGLL